MHYTYHAVFGALVSMDVRKAFSELKIKLVNFQRRNKFGTFGESFSVSKRQGMKDEKRIKLQATSSGNCIMYKLLGHRSEQTCDIVCQGSLWSDHAFSNYTTLKGSRLHLLM